MLRQHRKSLLSRDQPSKNSSKKSLLKTVNSSQAMRPRKGKHPSIAYSDSLFKEMSRGEQKQNCRMSENTPKLQEMEREDSHEVLDQLSQIKFISKECSTIKENAQDVNSSSTTHHQIEDFSPLFERLDSKHSKDDFLLSIEGIQQNDIFSQIGRLVKGRQFSSERIRRKDDGYSNSIQQSQLQQQFQFPQEEVLVAMKPIKNLARTGKIRKNQAREIVIEQPKSSEICSEWLENQIFDVYLTLNSDDSQYLKKNNCNSESLSTELNYLIGSILTKIKVKGQQYNYQQFSEEFKLLIEELQPEELQDILSRNTIKKKSQSKKPQIKKLAIPAETLKEVSFQASPTFQGLDTKRSYPYEKIHKINDKLSSYLLKNNLYDDQTLSKKVTSQTAPIHNSVACMKRELSSSQNARGLTLSKTMSFSEDQHLKNGSSTSVWDSFKVTFSLKHDQQTIKGQEGQEFQLSFTELNKHL